MISNRLTISLLIKFGLALSLLLALNINGAAHAAEQRIAVVDSTKLVETSKALQSISKQVEEKEGQYRKEVRKSEAKLKKRQQNLEAKKSALSQEALDKKKVGIDKDFASLQHESSRHRVMVHKAANTAMRMLLDKVSSIVEKIAKNKGYSMVVEKTVTQYAISKIDLTDIALTRLDKELPFVKVDFVAAEKSIDAVNVKQKSSSK